MKNLGNSIVGLLALMGAWAVLVADSDDGRCTAGAGFEVTYDYVTDCMGTNGQGRMTLRGPTLDRVYPKGEPDPELAAAAAQAGFNAERIAVSYDISRCTESDGLGRPNGFTFNIYGVPVDGTVEPPTTPVFRCHRPGKLNQDAEITCESLVWMGGPNLEDPALDEDYTVSDIVEADPRTCDLTLTFVPHE